MSGPKKVVSALRAMVKEDDAAHAFLGWLAKFSNKSMSVNVETVERDATKWGRENIDEEIVLSRQEIIAIMKQLEELQLGRFIVGRRGAESRFEFWTHRGHIGKAAVGELDRIDIQEDDVELDVEELREAHRMLIANALGKPLSAVHIIIKD